MATVFEAPLQGIPSWQGDEKAPFLSPIRVDTLDGWDLIDGLETPDYLEGGPGLDEYDCGPWDCIFDPTFAGGDRTLLVNYAGMIDRLAFYPLSHRARIDE